MVLVNPPLQLVGYLLIFTKYISTCDLTFSNSKLWKVFLNDPPPSLLFTTVCSIVVIYFAKISPEIKRLVFPSCIVSAQCVGLFLWIQIINKQGFIKGKEAHRFFKDNSPKLWCFLKYSIKLIMEACIVHMNLRFDKNKS